jgi:hypothetical protein
MVLHSTVQLVRLTWQKMFKTCFGSFDRPLKCSTIFLLNFPLKWQNDNAYSNHFGHSIFIDCKNLSQGYLKDSELGTIPPTIFCNKP